MVNFTSDDQTSLVPETWLIGKSKCRWPRHRDPSKFIKAQSSPEADWLEYEVEVLCDFGDAKYAEAYAKYVEFCKQPTEEEELEKERSRKHPISRIPGFYPKIRNMNEKFIG